MADSADHAAAELERTPPWLVHASDIAGRVIVLALLVWGAAELASKLTLLVMTLLVALLIAGVIHPAVTWTTSRWSLRPWIAPLLATLLVLAVTVGAAIAIGARVASEAPELLRSVEESAQQLGTRFGVDVPSLSSGGAGTGGGGDGGDGGGGPPLGNAQEILTGAFEGLFAFFLTLVFAPHGAPSGRTSVG